MKIFFWIVAIYVIYKVCKLIVQNRAYKAQQNQAAAQNPFKAESPRSAGEYIDFEEIK